MSITTVSSDSSGGGGGNGNSCIPAEGARPVPPSRYESQKRRDWNTFGQYLKNHRPPLALSRCSGAHVLEFLRYLDQFGKTKVHAAGCPFFGHPHPPAPCPCPLRQAWGSLDALIGRLRAAFEENGGQPEANPFGARAVRLYLREVRDTQSKARGIAYEKKKRKKPPPPQQQQQVSQGLASPPSVYHVAAPVQQAPQPNSQLVDLNSVNGVYHPHLLLHGHVLIPSVGGGAVASGSSGGQGGGGGGDGSGSRGGGGLFSPERLLLCEM